MLPAPPTFSIMIGCLITSDMRWPSSRASASVGPPAANGTTSVIARSGNAAIAGEIATRSREDTTETQLNIRCISAPEKLKLITFTTGLQAINRLNRTEMLNGSMSQMDQSLCSDQLAMSDPAPIGDMPPSDEKLISASRAKF
jgi:hypothetical protein